MAYPVRGFTTLTRCFYPPPPPPTKLLYVRNTVVLFCLLFVFLPNSPPCSDLVSKRKAKADACYIRDWSLTLSVPLSETSGHYEWLCLHFKAFIVETLWKKCGIPQFELLNYSVFIINFSVSAMNCSWSSVTYSVSSMSYLESTIYFSVFSMNI